MALHKLLIGPESPKWLSYAVRKLAQLKKRTPRGAVVQQSYTPLAGTLITVQTNGAEDWVTITVGGGLYGLICIPAADEAPLGWGKPFTTSLGTVGGNNPWSVVQVPVNSTSFTILAPRGLPNKYFPSGDDVTYSIEPNAGNVAWGSTRAETVTWKAPQSGYGPAIFSADNSDGELVMDCTVITADGVPHAAYIQPQFGYKVFANGVSIATFPDYVLGAARIKATSTGAEIPGVPAGADISGVVAFTTTSLSTKAGLKDRVYVQWGGNSTPQLLLEIDVASLSVGSGVSVLPHIRAASFDSSGKKAIVLLDTTSISSAYGSLNSSGTFDQPWVLKVDLTDLYSPTYAPSSPLINPDTTKRIKTVVSPNPAVLYKTFVEATLLSCGYIQGSTEENYVWVANVQDYHVDLATYYFSTVMADSQGVTLIAYTGGLFSYPDVSNRAYARGIFFIANCFSPEHKRISLDFLYDTTCYFTGAPGEFRVGYESLYSARCSGSYGKYTIQRLARQRIYPGYSSPSTINFTLDSPPIAATDILASWEPLGTLFQEIRHIQHAGLLVKRLPASTDKYRRYSESERFYTRGAGNVDGFISSQVTKPPFAYTGASTPADVTQAYMLGQPGYNIVDTALATKLGITSYTHTRLSDVRII